MKNIMFTGYCSGRDALSLVVRKAVFGVFRPGPTQTGLYSHWRWLEACNFVFRKLRDCTIRVVKTKALISFAVTDYLQNITVTPSSEPKQWTNGPVNTHLTSVPGISTTSNCYQIWPSQGQHMVIIYINCVDLEPPRVHAKFQDHGTPDLKKICN